MQRPPVSEAENQAIKNLVAALATAETYHCSGTAHYAGVPEPKLIYTTDTGAKALSIVNAETGDLDELHNSGTASRFKQDLDDSSNQPARELLADCFGLNFAPLEGETDVLAAISAFCKVGVKAKMHRLSSFRPTKGGRVKVHKGEGYLGTLLMGLYPPPESAERLLHLDRDKVQIDWNNSFSHSATDTMALPWTFFYSDVACEIQLDESRHQLILVYDIYRSETVQYYQNPTVQAMDIRSTQFYKSLDALLKNPQVLPDGGILAFGLTYAYPRSVKESRERFTHKRKERLAIPRVSDSDRIVSTLKGSDATMYHTLKESELKVRVKAVYLEHCYDHDEYVDDARSEAAKGHTAIDDYCCFKRERSYTDECRVLLTADSFTGFDDDIRANHGGDENSTPMELLESELGAKIASDMIWVRTPEVFHEANSFLNWGKVVDHNAVSTAFVVDIPRVVEGRRQGF
ncbi:hypothetical protein FRB94_013000 [Tulasnella sp. JGI-2019a]|nr:hypothetical protein FRB93_001727 [Tulasnella sp. JGI-2019a]KAG9008775.1 hypothetical protein FRB94_013000 [Tulasnella sp. JGI-2019a]